MIGYDDRRCTCLHCFQCSFSGHDTFYNKRNPCHLCHFMKFFHGLASSRRHKVFQERKSGTVNIHGNGKCSGLFHHLHFFFDGLQIPRFYSRDTCPACCLNRCGCTDHHLLIGSVAGKCGNSAFCTGIYQNIIVSQVIIFIPIMQGHGSYRACKERVFESLSKKFQRGIHRTILVNRVHIHSDLLPFLIIADRIVSHTLGTRSRHLVFTCPSITYRTDLTVGSHISSCCIHYFFEIHLYLLSGDDSHRTLNAFVFFCSAENFRTPALCQTIQGENCIRRTGGR